MSTWVLRSLLGVVVSGVLVSCGVSPAEIESSVESASEVAPANAAEFMERFLEAERVVLEDSDLRGRVVAVQGLENFRVAFEFCRHAEDGWLARAMLRDGDPYGLSYHPNSRSRIPSSGSNMSFWVKESIVDVRVPGGEEAFRESRNFLLSPEETLTPVEVSWVRREVGPERPSLELDQMMRTTGRGLLRQLDPGSYEVSPFSDDEWLVHGPGHFYKSRGEWTLVVDVTAGYIVRQATFLNDGRVALTVRTEGTVGRFPRAVAKAGTVHYPGHGTTTWGEVTSVGAPTAELRGELEGELRRLVAHPKQNNSKPDAAAVGWPNWGSASD